MKVQTENNIDIDFPTRITEDYWVYASVTREQRNPQKFKNSKSGKWLVFSENKDHDRTWQRIKQATSEGLLGIHAKAATSKSNANASSDSEKVICIYTYNWLDTVDVFRVEKTLREIGIEQTLFYKADRDTREGKYKVKGNKNISKYVSKATKSYKKFDLDSLHGIGSDNIDILNKIGINNFDDLLAFDTSKKLYRVGITAERIVKLKLAALSQIENKIYRLTPTEFPEGEIIHFDIETDLSLSIINKKVWSIAIHHKKKVKRFFAETWEEEKTILINFLAFLKKINSPQLFSYSGVGFDKNIIVAALKRHNLDYGFFLNCTHHDLCTLLRQNYILPIGSYGLKQVGKYLGYPFKHDHLDGLYVARQYLQAQRNKTKIPKSIFDYIDDDVKSMDYIYNQIKSRTDIKHLI
jgi:predicted RecB family nuclease